MLTDDPIKNAASQSEMGPNTQVRRRAANGYIVMPRRVALRAQKIELKDKPQWTRPLQYTYKYGAKSHQNTSGVRVCS